MSRDIFKSAVKFASFNQWLTEVPEEDLQYISDLLDKVGTGKDLDEQEADSYEQLVALIIHYSGKGTLTEKEIEDYMLSLVVNAALELNVRKGDMTKTGVYSLLKDEETAKFSMTHQGEERVRNMIEGIS